MKTPRTLTALAVMAVFTGSWPAAIAQQSSGFSFKKSAPERELMVSQMIVKLRNPKASELTQPLGADRVSAMSARAGVQLTGFRAMSGNASVLKMDRPMSLSDAQVAAQKIAADPSVEYAEPDLPVRAYQTAPSDVGYLQRNWHYFAPTATFTSGSLNGGAAKNVTTTGGANLPGAWSVTTGSANVVVAVVDTGVSQTHPELQPRLLAGRDFVSNNVGSGVLPAGFVENDGVAGRDGDPSDPGDWVSATEKTMYGAAAGDICYDGIAGQTNSTWHGTHMAGTIVGTWNNGIGATPPAGTATAGIAPNIRVLPVRALGKCGGTLSDVADAVRWSAGVAVTGQPPNTNAAQIINLSLGSSAGACGVTYSQAVNDATAAGALVIAAAGNDGLNAVSQPANCPGVLAVTGHSINGDNATYANIGPQVGISAPGGGTPSALASTIGVNDVGFYTWSSVLFGLTTPASADGMGRTGPAIGGFTGTSSATAHVSAVAALVKSVRPASTPTELANFIRNSARPHPAGTFCLTAMGLNNCGTGLLDASAAVALAGGTSSGGGANTGNGGGGAFPLWSLGWLLVLAAIGQARRLSHQSRHA